MFHLVLAAATLYLAMVVTDWTVLVQPVAPDAPPPEPLPLFAQSNGLAAMWLQWVAAALSLLLYIWSLIAPLLVPHRDFS